MEHTTLVGTIILVVSIIYNILTKLKNSGLTKELLELEDALTDEKTKVNHYHHEHLKIRAINRTLNEALDKAGRVELVVEDIKPKVSRTKKSK